MTKRLPKINILQPDVALFLPAIVLPYADTLIIADLHTPYQNTPLLKQAMRLAYRAGIKRVIIAGDLQNNKAYNSQAIHEPQVPIELEYRHSKSVLDALMVFFDEVVLVSGNHDEYNTKKNKISFDTYIRDNIMLGTDTTKIITTERDYVYMDDNWLIGHSSGYELEAGKYAASIALNYNKNVIIGHDHLRGIVTASNGKIGVSLGCMLVADRFFYSERRLNHFKPFQLGFGLILNKQFYHYNEIGNEPYNGIFHTFDWWETFIDNKDYLRK